MAFPGARRKLDEARRLAEGLQGAADAPTFRTLFSAFLGAAKAVVASLRKDGARRPGFRKWHDAKLKELRHDDLIRFVLDARDADVHEGRHRLLFDTDLQHFDTSQAGPPPGGYPASMVFGPEGPAWLVDDGKPSRRLVPIRQGGSWTTHVAIANAPAGHRGKPLANRDPVSICAIVVDYLGELVHEAETHFPEQ